MSLICVQVILSSVLLLCHIYQRIWDTAFVYYKKRKWWLKLLFLRFSFLISISALASFSRLVIRLVDMSENKSEHWEIIVRYNSCFQQIRCAVFFSLLCALHAKAPLKFSMYTMCSTLIWQRFYTSHGRRQNIFQKDNYITFLALNLQILYSTFLWPVYITLKLKINF